MDWLKEKRLEANLTQEEVAVKVGVNRATVTKIENGSRTPSIWLAKRLGETLGFDWTRFYEEEPEPEAG
jgi:DNA-binding XRE family transcriptional regulator